MFRSSPVFHAYYHGACISHNGIRPSCIVHSFSQSKSTTVEVDHDWISLVAMWKSMLPLMLIALRHIEPQLNAPLDRCHCSIQLLGEVRSWWSRMSDLVKEHANLHETTPEKRLNNQHPSRTTCCGVCRHVDRSVRGSSNRGDLVLRKSACSQRNEDKPGDIVCCAGPETRGELLLRELSLKCKARRHGLEMQVWIAGCRNLGTEASRHQRHGLPSAGTFPDSRIYDFMHKR